MAAHAVLPLLLALSPLAHCAGIRGSVTSDAGPVAGAFVQTQAGHLVVADPKGRYDLPGLPAATYALRVCAAGMEPQVIGSIAATGNVTQDVKLQAAAQPLGIVHVRTTGADPPGFRLVVRAKPAGAAEFAAPDGSTGLAGLQQMDTAGRPIQLAAHTQAWSPVDGAWLWARGEAALPLPPGEVELTISRGPGWRVVQQTAAVTAGQVTVVDVPLARIVDLPVMGWIGGDAHCHVYHGGYPEDYATNLPLAANVCRGEGMDWAFLAPDYGKDTAQGDPWKVVEAEATPSFLWSLNGEIREPWGGHLVVVGPREAFGREAGQVPVPLTEPHCRKIQRLLQVGAACIYTHPLREYGEQQEPGGQRVGFANLAGELPFDLMAEPNLVRILDLQTDDMDGEVEFALWRMLLDRGYRIAAASFTDATLDNGNFPVTNRTYAYVGQDRSITALVGALLSGHTFVTSGPLLQFSVGGALPGDVLPTDNVPRSTLVEAWMASLPGQGLSQVQLLRNGTPIQTWDLSAERPEHFRTELLASEGRPAWYIVKAYASNRDTPATAQVAWTSPVYFAPQGLAPPQTTYAAISGTVKDAATGAPVPGAEVQFVVGAEVVETVKTDQQGSYSLTAPAACAVRVTHPRYKVIESPMTPEAASRETETTKYLAWDIPAIHDAIGWARATDLLDWQTHEKLRAESAQARLDFALTAR